MLVRPRAQPFSRATSCGHATRPGPRPCADEFLLRGDTSRAQQTDQREKFAVARSGAFPPACRAHSWLHALGLVTRPADHPCVEDAPSAQVPATLSDWNLCVDYCPGYRFPIDRCTRPGRLPTVHRPARRAPIVRPLARRGHPRGVRFPRRNGGDVLPPPLP